jgi:hypothetical protein
MSFPRTVRRAASALLFLAACRPDPKEEQPRPTVQAPDAAMIRSVLARPSDHLPSPKTLTMTWNPGHNAPMQAAIAVAERGLLRVIASKSPALDCEQPEATKGDEWMSMLLDPGPRGDFHVGHVVTTSVAFAVKGDLVAWRETYAAHSRIEIAPFGPEDTGELRVQWKRVLHNPDPPVLTTVNGSGSMAMKICPSARALVAHEPFEPMTTGPVEVRIGDRKFQPQKALAFLFDDGKNGPIFSSFGFYASPDADCEATTRQLSDNGGGVDGLQVETGQVGAAPSAMNLLTPLSVNLEVNDVIAGGRYFRSQPQTPEKLYGTIVITTTGALEPGGSLAGFIHADGRALGERSTDAFISGSFVATICKRTWW